MVLCIGTYNLYIHTHTSCIVINLYIPNLKCNVLTHNLLPSSHYDPSYPVSFTFFCQAKSVFVRELGNSHTDTIEVTKTLDALFRQV